MNRRKFLASVPAAMACVGLSQWPALSAAPMQRRADFWFAQVVGVPPGKERCSSAAFAGFVYGGKRWVEDESVPDFLLLARVRPQEWNVMRGYQQEGRIRRNRSFRTLREARAYAVLLTGRLLSPWLAVPMRLTEEKDLLAFAASAAKPVSV